MLSIAARGARSTVASGRTWLAGLLLFACAAPAVSGNGPDVIVGGTAVSGSNGSNQNDTVKWGSSGSITAYSIATTSCNVGTAQLQWVDSTPAHPVIGQNMFRLKDGRFEQIGQSWLKHAFCALSQNLCSTSCQGTGCSTLGIGCSDPYTASRNGSQSLLGPKYQVNAATGVFPYPHPSPSGNSTIRGRLQVHTNDVTPSLNPGALYFVEGQYVTADDASFGNQNNNASWRQVTINSSLFLTTTGTTHQMEPGILAWFNTDPTVNLAKVSVPNDGLFWLLYQVTDLGNGTWHYEYAIQNLNSDRSGQSFSIPIPAGVNVTNIGFHDVDYHSGDGIGGVNQDGTDWPGVVSGGSLTWATTDFATDQNANALRWGTLYNFRFDADVPPESGAATLGLFKPGTPTSATAAIQVPSVPTVCACLGDVDGSNTIDGGDIQLFVDMAVGGSPVDPCAEVAAPDGVPLDMADVSAMVSLLLAGTPCP